jgi:t-SNARE complex subunit (syntaxin)
MGDLTRKVHLRRYDFFREEKEHINEMIDALSHTVGKIKIDHNKLLSSLNENDQGNALKQAQRPGEHLSAFKLAGSNKPSG